MNLRKHFLTAGLAATLGFAAIAQTPPPAAPAQAGAPHMQARHGQHDANRMQERQARKQQRMQEQMAMRLNYLKQKLNIAPAQEGAWSAWTSAMQPVRTVRAQRGKRGEFAQLTTPQRIDRMRALRDARTAAVDRRLDATKAFYGALSAEQQKVFDADARRIMRMGRGKGGRGGHRHHG